MIIYVSKNGNVKVNVNVQNEDIWMSQDLIFMIQLKIIFLYT